MPTLMVLDTKGHLIRTGCSPASAALDLWVTNVEDAAESRMMMNRISSRLASLLAALCTWTFADVALAHHPLGGMPMETVQDGLLSGLAHPVLGFDHLAFVVAVGLCALRCASPARAPAAYIFAMLAGCAMMPLGVSLPGKEGLVAASLVVLGAVVLAKPNISSKAAMALFAFFGLFHGSALGDGLAGAEFGAGSGVIFGYLAGLGVVQYLVARLGAAGIERIFSSKESPDLSLRLAGAMVAGIGIFVSAEKLEGAALSLLGWG